MNKNTYQSLLTLISNNHDEVCDRMLRANNIIYNKVHLLEEVIRKLLPAPDNTLVDCGNVDRVPPALDLRDEIPTQQHPPPSQKWYTVNRRGRIIPEHHEQFMIPLNNRFELLDTHNFVNGGENRYASKCHNIEFVEDTVLNAPMDHSIAHCVSRDFHCGAGFAKSLKSLYFGKSGMDILKSRERNVGDIAALPIEHGRFILNLITKELYHGKPTLGDIERSLWSLRSFCHEFEVYNVAMPLIACGLDKQKWSEVQKLLEKIFGDTYINIKIYTAKEKNLEWPLPGENFYSPPRPNSASRHNSKSRRKNERVKTPNRTLITSTPTVSTNLSNPTTSLVSDITVSDGDDKFETVDIDSDADVSATQGDESATQADVSATQGDESATPADESAIPANLEDDVRPDVSPTDVEDDVVPDAEQPVTPADVEDNVVSDGDTTVIRADEPVDDVREAPATSGDTPRRSPALAAPHGVESPQHGVSPEVQASGESCILTPASDANRHAPLIPFTSRSSTRSNETTTPRTLFLTQSSEDLLVQLELERDGQQQPKLPVTPLREQTIRELPVPQAATCHTPTLSTTQSNSSPALRRSSRVIKQSSKTENFQMSKLAKPVN